ncbi:neuromodulin-like [Eutrema salsugineum]|uniref:neuromodulin-like n=1 Tax=Eutrema salsugineum TaxID=72664 RepID=UPI000CED6117|nr:neuromodulin-like [Eutrema salsugineum]
MVKRTRRGLIGARSEAKMVHADGNEQRPHLIDDPSEENPNPPVAATDENPAASDAPADSSGTFATANEEDSQSSTSVNPEAKPGDGEAKADSETTQKVDEDEAKVEENKKSGESQPLEVQEPIIKPTEPESVAQDQAEEASSDSGASPTSVSVKEQAAKAARKGRR